MHRDVKPANIFLETPRSPLVVDWVAVLGDFGCARVVKKATVWPHYAASGAVAHHSADAGTLWYRAPEILGNHSAYGLAVDLWMLGATFLEIEIGRPVFQGRDEGHQLALVQRLCQPVAAAEQRFVLEVGLRFGARFRHFARQLLTFQAAQRITASALEAVCQVARSDVLSQTECRSWWCV